jgi:hypothetical protein
VIAGLMEINKINPERRWLDERQNVAKKNLMIYLR